MRIYEKNEKCNDGKCDKLIYLGVHYHLLYLSYIYIYI